MKTNRQRACAAIAVLGALLLPTAASAQTTGQRPAAGTANPAPAAQPAPAPGATGAAATPSTEAPASGSNVSSTDMQATERIQNGRRVYVANTTIEVRGEIQRPYAFSVSGRSSLGYTYFETPVHFVREILEAVRRPPFKP